MSDHKLHQGDTREIPYEVIDDETGFPMLFPPGSSGQWTLSRSVGYPPFISKPMTLETGRATVALSSADTQIPPGIHLYQFRLVRAGSADVTKFGQLTVLPSYV